jgi:hypothetical protein
MAKKCYSSPVISPLHRASFIHLFTPEKKTGQDGSAYDEYSVTMLIPKTDPEITRLVAAHDEVMAQLYGADKTKWPRFRNPTFRDGDTDPTYSNREKYPDYGGMWIVKATSNSKPGLLDERKQPVITNETLYSGMWGYAQVTAANYDMAGNQGIKFYLQNYMKFKDDTPFGGSGMSAETAFADLPMGASPAPAAPGMPAAPAAPAAPQAPAAPAAPAAPVFNVPGDDAPF